MKNKFKKTVPIELILCMVMAIIGSARINAKAAGKTIYQDQNVIITFEGIGKSDFGGNSYDVNFSIDNLSGRAIVVQVRDTSINGLAANPICSIELAAGAKAKDRMLILGSDANSTPMNQVKEIDTKFHIFDWSDFDFGYDTNVVRITDIQSSIEPSKTFNGCKGSPVEISISGNSTNVLTFKCEDGCAFKSEKTGESSIVIGGSSIVSSAYSLTFDRSGSHKVFVYNYLGEMTDVILFNIAENHAYDDGVITQQATCKKDGIKTFTCSTCSKVRTEVIPATGEHLFSDWEISEEPTALEEGKETRTCLRCGEEESRTVEKLEASVALSKNQIRIKTGKKVTLKIKDKTYGDSAKSWKTSNKKVASIAAKGNKCVVKALKPGKSTITLTMESGCKATCKITAK